MSEDVQTLTEQIAASPVKLGALTAAYIKAKLEMSPLIADKVAVINSSKGPFKYNYTDLANAYDVCEAALGKHGIGVWQDVYTYYADRYAEVEVHTLLYHAESEQYRVGGRITLRSSVATPSPQDMGTLITYARRYSLLASVGLAAEDDDGKGASETPKNETKKAAGHRQPPAQPPAVTPEQARLITQANTLGQELYAEQWPNTRKRNVGRLAEGKTALEELTAEQLDRLISGLNTLKAQRAPEGE